MPIHSRKLFSKSLHISNNSFVFKVFIRPNTDTLKRVLNLIHTARNLSLMCDTQNKELYKFFFPLMVSVNLLKFIVTSNMWSCVGLIRYHTRIVTRWALHIENSTFWRNVWIYCSCAVGIFIRSLWIID